MKPTAEEVFKDYTAKFNIRERGDYIHKGEAITFAKYYAAAVKSEPAEGAEDDTYKSAVEFIHNSFTDLSCEEWNKLIDVVIRHAALHAQRLADKMVEDMYPKEFFDWYAKGEHRFGKIEGLSLLLFIHFDEGSKKKYTSDELFNYWKENVK